LATILLLRIAIAPSAFFFHLFVGYPQPRKVLLYLKKNATDRIVPFRSFILKVPLIKGDLGG